MMKMNAVFSKLMYRLQCHPEIHPDRLAASDGFAVHRSGFPARHGLHKPQSLLIAAVSQTTANVCVAHCPGTVYRECDLHRPFNVAHSGIFRITQVLYKKIGELFAATGELSVLHIGAFGIEQLRIRLVEQERKKQEKRSHDSMLI